MESKLIRMCIRGVGLTVLFLLISAPADAAGTRCSAQDVTSKDAERCTQRYARDLAKCIRQRGTLANCDTTSSLEVCGRLSPACTPRDAVDNALGVIYGAGISADPCRLGLFSDASKLISRRFTRARTGRLTKLQQDLSSCSSHGASKCSAAPTVTAPCSDLQSADDVAACICGIQIGCAEVFPEEFLGLIVGGWSATRDHAMQLGYTDLVAAYRCPTISGTNLLTARLVRPSAPDESLTLFYSDDGQFSYLAQPDADGTVTLFNEGGGVRMPPRGTLQVVSPEGTPPSQSLRPLVGVGSVCDWTDYLGCETADGIRYGKYGSCLLAAGAGLACAAVAHGALFLAPACAPALPLVKVCSILLTSLPIPGCDDLGLNTNGRPCDSGTICTSAHCMRGSCQFGEAVNEGRDCSAEYRTLPFCTGGVFGQIGGQLVTSATCRVGLCQTDRSDCDPCQICDRASQTCACGPSSSTTSTSTTTTTSSTTTTTLPPCGNGTCDGGETCANCPADCGACPLSAWWTFDGDYSDSSGSQIDGTPIGTGNSFDTATFKQGTASLSTTDGGYVTYGNNLNLKANDPLTISLWMRSSAAPAALVAKQPDWVPHSYPGWILVINGFNGIYWQMNAGTSFRANEVQVNWFNLGISDGNWHHLALTKAASPRASTVTLYVDGVAIPPSNIDSDTLTADPTNGSDLSVGAEATGLDTFVGNLDSIKIENREWSAADVQREFNSP